MNTSWSWVNGKKNNVGWCRSDSSLHTSLLSWAVSLPPLPSPGCCSLFLDGPTSIQTQQVLLKATWALIISGVISGLKECLSTVFFWGQSEWGLFYNMQNEKSLGQEVLRDSSEFIVTEIAVCQVIHFSHNPSRFKATQVSVLRRSFGRRLAESMPTHFTSTYSEGHDLCWRS